MMKVLIVLLSGIVSLFASVTTRDGTPIQAIIFDCDGVLVDTEYLKFLAWQEAIATEGVSFSIDDYQPLIGYSSKKIFSMIKEQKQQDISESVIELKNAHYHRLQKQGVPPIEAMIAIAKHLSQAKEQLGLKLVLASSAPRQEILENLRQIGLQDAFDVVISGTDDLEAYIDAEGKNKPKPYIYLEAAKQLQMTPAQCLVFEDTTAGIEAAHGAGMIPIAVPNSFTIQQDFSKAAAVIKSHQEIENIIKLFYLKI